jgi:CDP-paratose 2-epimerase
MNPSHPADSRPVLITGGAGFIGCNLADHFLTRGKSVVLYDNLSRPGVAQNAQWLRQRHGARVRLIQSDVRDAQALASAIRACSAIYHFAAQVAVTSSLVDPEFDFAVNAGGTLNVLHALREMADPPPLLFTSTNKVYGKLQRVSLRKVNERYEPVDPDLRARGISEEQPLDFCSPYGCSKGTADQYVLDHALSYGLRAVVFRMSCIYGPHQFGTEDQGWVAHFLMQARNGNPIVLYGDGHQVRDILYVTDLVEALDLAVSRIDTLKGCAFNIGGGPANTVSLLEIVGAASDLASARIPIVFDAWRQGDQPYYVSDTARFQAATGWRPAVSPGEGLKKLNAWLQAREETKPALVSA